MDLLLNAFISVLESEIDLYRFLLVILQQEKQAVFSSQLKELNESSKEKENIILKIRICEEQRLKILEKIASSLGVKVHELTVTKLSQSVHEPFSSRLTSTYTILSSLVESVKEINNTNKALILHSLELVKGSLSLLSNLLYPHSIYFRSGKIEPQSQSGMVVSGKT